MSTNQPKPNNNKKNSMEMDNNKCGCWSVLKRGVCKPSTSRHSPNSIPRTSVVHDAGFFLLSFMVFLFLLNIMDEYNVKNVSLVSLRLFLGLGVFVCPIQIVSDTDTYDYIKLCHFSNY